MLICLVWLLLHGGAVGALGRLCSWALGSPGQPALVVNIVTWK